jgi:hypothetical protein
MVSGKVAEKNNGRVKRALSIRGIEYKVRMDP